MNRVLPLLNPPVLYTPPNDLVLSMLNSSRFENQVDIANNFIEIIYKEDAVDGWVEFFGFNNYCNYQSLDFAHIPRDYCISTGQLITMTITLLELGYYILTKISTHYLSCYDNSRLPCSHEVTIYGYDAHLHILYLRDYFSPGKWVCAQCSYEEFSKGFYQHVYEDYLDGYIAIRQGKKKKEITFRPEIIVQKINFIFSGSCPSIIKADKEYGIGYFDEMKKRIKSCILYQRHFDFIYAHIVLMKCKLDFLQSFLPQDIEFSELINKCNNVLISAKQLQLYVLHEKISKTRRIDYSIHYNSIYNNASMLLERYSILLHDIAVLLQKRFNGAILRKEDQS